jgi:hypothetical protein
LTRSRADDRAARGIARARNLLDARAADGRELVVALDRVEAALAKRPALPPY